MQTVVLSVPDISCEHCERTITQTLSPMEGVSSVNVDIPGKQVRVQFEESQVDVERMKEALQEEDYPVAAATPA